MFRLASYEIATIKLGLGYKWKRVTDYARSVHRAVYPVPSMIHCKHRQVESFDPPLLDYKITKAMQW